MAHRRNAPLKGARQIGSNMTEVEHGDLTVLYSYETPVAFLSPRGGYVTEKKWSVTTSKHIAKFFDRHGYDRKGAFKVPQEDLEMFVSTGSLAGSEMGAGRVTRSNPRDDYYERMQRDPERAQPDDFKRYRRPGKFEGEPNIAQRLYEMEPDQELGDVQDFGWFGLFLDVATADGTLSFIVSENDQGFYGIEDQGSAKDMQAAWDELEEQYADEYEAED